MLSFDDSITESPVKSVGILADDVGAKVNGLQPARFGPSFRPSKQLCAGACAAKFLVHNQTAEFRLPFTFQDAANEDVDPANQPPDGQFRHRHGVR